MPESGPGPGLSLPDEPIAYGAELAPGERRLAPYAASRVPTPRAADARVGLPDALARAARPRPRPAFDRLPASHLQDADVPVPRGRPFPDPPDALPRGRPDRAHRRPAAPPRRGPGRGPGAGARPRPSPVRPRRRACARCDHGPARRLRPQCPELSNRDAPGAQVRRVRRPEPDVGDARRLDQAQRSARARDRGERRRAAARGAPFRCPDAARPDALGIGRGAGRSPRRRHRLDDARHRRRAARRPRRLCRSRRGAAGALCRRRLDARPQPMPRG